MRILIPVRCEGKDVYLCKEFLDWDRGLIAHKLQQFAASILEDSSCRSMSWEDKAGVICRGHQEVTEEWSRNAHIEVVSWPDRSLDLQGDVLRVCVDADGVWWEMHVQSGALPACIHVSACLPPEVFISHDILGPSAQFCAGAEASARAILMQDGETRASEGNLVALQALYEYLDIPYTHCKFCHLPTPERTAHIHQGRYVGDQCCWDERLRTTE